MKSSLRRVGYTPEEDAKLKELMDAGNLSYEEMGRILHRQVGSIASRIYKLGLAKRKHKKERQILEPVPGHQTAVGKIFSPRPGVIVHLRTRWEN